MSDGIPPGEKVAWLRLARTGGVGPRTFRKLIQRFGTVARALERLPGVVRECGWDSERFRVCTDEEAQAELDGLARIGARLLLLC